MLIALFDANDAHHVAAEEMFAVNPAEPMTIGPINQAEVLVRAARENRDQLTAEQTSARVATFDEGLKESARSIGLAVV